MADTFSVAKYLNELYKAEEKKDMPHSLLLNLMYYVQRESVIQTKKDATLFAAQFKGWSYGPVLTMLRDELKKGNGIPDGSPLSDSAKEIIKATYERYKLCAPRTLDRLTHDEISWQLSREGLSPDEKGDVSLLANAIRIDAVREEIRRELEAQDHE